MGVVASNELDSTYVVTVIILLNSVSQNDSAVGKTTGT